MTPRGSRRVLPALVAGAGLGSAVALLVQAAISRTASPLPPERAFWQLILLAFAGGLSGFGLSAVSALQASNPDPAYHPPRRSRRPPGRRSPPGTP